MPSAPAADSYSRDFRSPSSRLRSVSAYFERFSGEVKKRLADPSGKA